MKNQGDFTSRDLSQIINNCDKRYILNGKDYLLIIKEEPGRPCYMFVSDCEQTIWSKLLDIAFFSKLKEQLQLASPMKVFTAHYVNSLKQASVIQRQKTVVVINIELQIGEGLVMSCQTRLDNRIHFNNPDEFKRSLRKFMINLWEIKCSQLGKQSQVFQEEKKEMIEKEKEKEVERVRPSYSAASAIKKNPFRKRDLMNPEKKKRKNHGAKLGTGFEADQLQTIARIDDDSD